MFQHTLIQSVATPSGQLNAGNKVYQGAASIEIDEVVLAAGTDFLINDNFPFANVKSFVVTSDQDVSLKTNSTSSPGNTLALKANVPYIWNSDSYDTFKITVDVTKWYATNAGAVNANLKFRRLSDPTP